MGRIFGHFPAVIAFIGLMVAVYFLAPWQAADSYGLVPRSEDHLIGIVGMHFLHGNIAHLTGNLTALAPLALLLAATHKSPWIAMAILIVLSGALLWFFGRPFSGPHIGASALVAALVGYLVARGVNLMTAGTIAVAVLVFSLYGISTLLGVDPALGEAGISWEGHLAGVVAGVVYGTFDEG